MSRDVEHLLAEFIERCEAGEALTHTAFLEEHPDVAPALRTALRELGRAEKLFPRSSAARPERVGEWRVLGELGRGGMGQVFRVTREGDPDGPTHALKLLGQGSLLDPRAVARIRREGELLRNLDHPGLVRVLDVGDDERGPWIVMELVEGETLAALLAAARWREDQAPMRLPGSSEHEDPWRAIALLGARLARAVEAAHAAGLLHRDIKPSNVIVQPDGAPVLIDFGLAVVEGSSTLTRTGDLVGTPQYMSPEQARGERADVRTDVWGLAGVLHELCTLHAPIEGADALAALERLRVGRPRLLASQGDIPPALARVIDRALAFRRRRRTSTTAKLAADLEACAEGKAPTAKSVGALERLEDVARARPRLMGGVITGLAVLLLALPFLRPPGANENAGPTPEELARAALRSGTLAWLARDRQEIEAAAQAIEAAGHPERAALLRALPGDAPLPEGGSDPLAVLLVESERAMRARDPAAAIALLAEASARAGDWSLPFVLLGRAAREAKDYERAEREWTAAVRLLDNSPHLYRRLGLVRRKRADTDGAARAFRRAVELDSEDWRNSAELARALTELGDPVSRSEALEAVDLALSHDPPTKRALLNTKAALLDDEGRREDAREIHEQILVDHPDHAGTWFNLAYTYDEDCLLTDAREAYEEAVRLEPGMVNAHVSLAKVATGSDAQKCERCAAAVDANPDLIDPDAVVYHLEAALEADRGRSEWLPHYSAELAIKAGRQTELVEVMQRLVGDREVDAEVVRLERALRLLRKSAD